MPSGKRIFWPQYDDLFLGYLPTMTVEDFTRAYLPDISTKAVSARARALGISPAKREKLSDEHKAKIARSLSVVEQDPGLINKIRALRQNTPMREIASTLGIGYATLARINKLYDIRLTEKGEERARESTRLASIGKVPWNIGTATSDETKARISAAVSGEFNGQFGRGMTDGEKVRWRQVFFAPGGGAEKLREFVKSPEGLKIAAQTLAITTSKEFREACSANVAARIADGTFKPHSNHKCGWHDSPKAGHIWYRSSYEQRYYEILDSDSTVIGYEVEPFVIPFEFGGITLNYIPDVLVLYEDGSRMLVEIKPSGLVSLPKNAAKIEAGTSFCDGHKLTMEVVTEFDLADGIDK